ncbi:phage holin [Anaerotruncus colihominis]
MQNPVVLLAAAASVFNAVTDPTTAGVGDSRRALEYKTPNRDE